MKITQDVREYAAKLGMDGTGELTEALEVGLREKAEEFREGGNRIYVTPEVAPGGD